MADKWPRVIEGILLLAVGAANGWHDSRVPLKLAGERTQSTDCGLDDLIHVIDHQISEVG